MNYGICGICGRMGLAVMRSLIARGHSLGVAFDHETAPNFGKSAGVLVNDPSIGVIIEAINPESMNRADVIIDFSSPSATLKLLHLAVENKKPLVIGTTGFSDEQISAIHTASRSIPILFSPNMSVGVNILFKLTEMAARAIGTGFDVEILEAHHRMKKDAPSGTAKKLIDIIKSSMPLLVSAEEKHGRSGITGERRPNELGVMAMRGGDIVGEHTVFFVGNGERIELTHRATNRDVLAGGAAIGMEFLSGKGPGLYSMYDVLGL